MTKALVVEDDDRMMEAIADTLFTLGHEHEWATNLQDARELIEANDFDYGLFDLEIPAKPRRGFANTEYGIRALEEFQHKVSGGVPALVMTGHHAFCMNHSVALRAKGAVDFIAKPFPLEGRTLGHMIREILPKPQAAESPTGTTFQGGPLVFRRSTVDLLGVTIVSSRGGGQAMALLRELARHDAGGRFVRLSGEDLAQSLGPPANIGTVTSCVRLIRSNATNRLKKQLGVVVGSQDVIAHDGQGYYLRDWITIDVGKPLVADVPEEPAIVLAGNSPEVLEGLNPRQCWVLRELDRGGAVERTMLEHRFDIAEKTAKRDLAELTAIGLIEFVRIGCGGHYRQSTTVSKGKCGT